tara:strand:+ start:35 stop:553 length:519 start_codon:yes stop_codon:yes gene_type:complete
MYLRIILSYFLSFFREILLFESKGNSKAILFKDEKIKKFKSIKNVKEKLLIKHLKETKKIQRFNDNQMFCVLYHKNKVTCFGWMHDHPHFYISEINKHIRIVNSNILYDFFTIPKFRNKGFYSKLLRLIKNTKNKKKFVIYCLTNNIVSKNGILKANFKLIKKINKYRDVRF